MHSAIDRRVAEANALSNSADTGCEYVSIMKERKLSLIVYHDQLFFSAEKLPDLLNKAWLCDVLSAFSTASASIFYVSIVMMDFVLIIDVFLTGS